MYLKYYIYVYVQLNYFAVEAEISKEFKLIRLSLKMW